MKKIIALLFCFASGFAYGQAATVFNKLQAGSLTIPSCTGIMTAAGASPVTCSSTIPLATGISGFGSGVAAALSMGLNTPSGITSGMIVANSIDLTGATDASSALQAIINNNPTKTIYIPAGTVQLANPITVNGGQVLRCEGRTQTIFFIPASFPLNAVGEITLGNGGNGAQIIDCGITFSQPSPLTRANIIKYPPAIYVKDLPRATIDRVRVSNGWECLDFVKMYSDITFNTNAYTTASGAFYLTGVNIYPIVRGGNSSGACVLENASNITSATPFFPEVQSNFVFFRTFISGGNASTLGNGNITPAKTGVEIRMSCSYRVR